MVNVAVIMSRMSSPYGSVEAPVGGTKYLEANRGSDAASGQDEHGRAGVGMCFMLYHPGYTGCPQTWNAVLTMQEEVKKKQSESREDALVCAVGFT